MPYAQILSPLVGAVAAALIATDRRLVRKLRSGGATTAERAAPIVVRSPLTRLRLTRLINVGVIRLEGSRFYLDLDGWQAWRAKRRRRALWLLAGTLAAISAAATF